MKKFSPGDLVELRCDLYFPAPFSPGSDYHHLVRGGALLTVVSLSGCDDAGNLCPVHDMERRGGWFW